MAAIRYFDSAHSAYACLGSRLFMGKEIAPDHTVACHLH